MSGGPRSVFPWRVTICSSRCYGNPKGKENNTTTTKRKQIRLFCFVLFVFVARFVAMQNFTVIYISLLNGGKRKEKRREKIFLFFCCCCFFYIFLFSFLLELKHRLVNIIQYNLYILLYLLFIYIYIYKDKFTFDPFLFSFPLFFFPLFCFIFSSPYIYIIHIYLFIYLFTLFYLFVLNPIKPQKKNIHKHILSFNNGRIPPTILS